MWTLSSYETSNRKDKKFPKNFQSWPIEFLFENNYWWKESAVIETIKSVEAFQPLKLTNSLKSIIAPKSLN